jgi:hypothetical protein
MPQTGFQGAIESLNLGRVSMPSVRTRFSLRKPPSAAYAAFSPPLYYADKPGEGKCTQCFIGGNFWDLRGIPAAWAALFNLFDGRKCVLKDVLKVG